MAVLVLSLSISLLLAELVARAFYDPPSQRMDGFSLSNSSYYRRDSELGWIPNPNVQGTHDLEGSFSTTFRTNSLGLRDREYDLEKPVGTTRIVVLGDSFTWGYGVGDDEIYTERLEESLANSEVINLGVTAYGLRQNIGYLMRLGLRFDPDIVILAFCQNDIFVDRAMLFAENEATIPENATSTGDISVPQDTPSRFLRLKRRLGEKVVLYQLFLTAFDSNRTLVKLAVRFGLKSELEGFEKMDPNIMPALRNYPPELERSWQETENEIRELNEITGRRGIRLILALVPALQSVDQHMLRRSLRYSKFELDEFDVDKPYSRLSAFAFGEGIEIVNPIARFREETTLGNDLFLPQEMHFNAKGHIEFAGELTRYLQSSTTRTP